MGIHNYYKNDPNRILMLNDKTESLGRRVSNGCINTLSQGAIFDNLTHYSKVYVCHES